MEKDAALSAYFGEAASWDADRMEQMRRNTRTAWRVAAAGWASAIMSAVALVGLTPLKSVQPYVVRVDNSTGIVDVVPIYTSEATVDEAVTRYLLTHYVRVCEGFSYALAERDYEECGAFHSRRRNQEWYAQWMQGNPASPLNVYKDGTTVRVDVKSVTFFQRSTGVSDLAQVRYVKTKRMGGTGPEEATHWIAMIQYAYVTPDRSAKVRQWNPLGLRIVEFRPEPEIAPPAVVTTAAESRASASSSERR